MRVAVTARRISVMTLCCAALGWLGCAETGVDRCEELTAAVAGAGADPAGGDAGAGSEGGAAGAAGAAGSMVSDDYAGDVGITVHDRVNTILVVSWTQIAPADATWLEFAFEGGQAMRSRPASGEIGEHRDVVLGVPERTDVSVRVVSSDGGVEYVSSEYHGATDALPSGLPKPEILAYDAARASPERWLLGSVEDSPGGAYYAYYTNTFWLYIMDRRGRIVWYYADPASNATSSFQRVARDGEYLWIEKRPFQSGGVRGVLKMTLDWEYFEEIPVPGLSDCIDVTDDGSLLYDADDELRELGADGEIRSVWSCHEEFGPAFYCYSNTINWDAARDSVLLSYPYENTVVEIDRATGELVGQYGNRQGSWRFEPPLVSPPEAWAFSFQHFPNFSPSGTLLVSSHVPGCSQRSEPGPRRHAFLEFELDRDRRTLLETWRYTDGLEWPRAKGMAIRLSNGNTLGNYGTGGVIREITPDRRTVFHVKFDTPQGSDFYNKMVGHNVLLDDLYALNGGPP